MIYKWIKYYSWKYIIDDTLAAISLSTVIIPQSLAYSQLAKLPAVYGLYVSIIPPLVYTVLGGHPYTSIGAFAIVSLVLAESLSSINIIENDFVGFASFLAFLVGLVELLLAVSGIITFLSRFLFKHSFISGFTVASVLTIITSQLKPFFGLQFQSQNGLFSVPKTWYLVIANIKTSNVATLALSVSTVFLIRASEFTETSIRKCLRKRKSKNMHAASNQQNQDQNVFAGDSESVVVSYEDNADEKTVNIFPSILFAVILLTFVSKLMDLPTNYDVRIVGNIPSGFPPFSWPWAVLSNINKDALFLAGQIIYRVLSLVIVCTLTSASVTDLYPGSNPQKAESHLSLEVLASEERRNNQVVKKGNTLNQEVLALSVSGILGIFMRFKNKEVFLVVIHHLHLFLEVQY
jgi:MFS superfamily sulfate permease-like transporter